MNSSSLRCDPLPGYFDNGNTACFKCPKECTACLTPTHCIECEYHNYLTRNNTCVDKCLTKLTTKDQPRPTCDNCPYDCITCNEYGECLTCNASEYRQLNPSNSRCEPMKGYYDDRSFVCKSCDEHCLDCLTILYCY